MFTEIIARREKNLMLKNNLKIYALGPFYIEIEGKRLDGGNWKERKSLALFKCLSIEFPKHISIERLIDKLWPECDEQYGKPRLYDTVYKLRKILDSDDSESYIIKLPEGYVLNKNKNYWFDWREFSDIYDKYKFNKNWPNYSKEELNQSIDELSWALNLYRGDFMENCLYDDLMDMQRTHYRQIMLDMVILLVKMLIKGDQNEKAINYLKYGIQEEPYREELYILFMQILGRENRVSEVVALYKRYKKILQKELGLSSYNRLEAEYKKIISYNMGTSTAQDDVNLEENMDNLVFGAMICNPKIFRKIYNLEKQKIFRGGNPFTILKISFDNVLNSELLEKFIVELSKNLRSVDVIAKWNSCSIYVLLHGTPIECNTVISQRLFKISSLSRIEEDPKIEWEEISKEKAQ
jgi:DNA-binding SARP family transcriptional activator